MQQQNEPRRYRAILPRTTSCYSEQQIQNQIEAYSTNLPTMHDDKRTSHEQYHVLQLGKQQTEIHSSRRETPRWNASSPRSIIICPEVLNEEGINVRFHWEQTSEYPISKESPEKCGVCNQRWELHSRWDSSEQSEKKYYKVIITGSRINSIREYIGEGTRKRSRVLYDEQEEDRRVLRVGTEEENETRAYLDGDIDYSDAWITRLLGEDLQVVEQEPVQAKSIRTEGVLHPWSDPDGEDDFDSLLGKILPYIPDPSI